jgi:hypothetical protein
MCVWINQPVKTVQCRYFTALSDSFKPHLYNGTLNYTEQGIACQRWDSTFPHTHKYAHEYNMFGNHFPNGESMLQENYCRDPDVNGFIWCYTMDPSIRWQKCPQPTKGNLFYHDIYSSTLCTNFVLLSGCSILYTWKLYNHPLDMLPAFCLLNLSVICSLHKF